MNGLIANKPRAIETVDIEFEISGDEGPGMIDWSGRLVGSIGAGLLVVDRLGRELEGEISAAGMNARELVQSVHEAHERSRLIFWASVGLLCALGLFCSGVWFGRLMGPTLCAGGPMAIHRCAPPRNDESGSGSDQAAAPS